MNSELKLTGRVHLVFRSKRGVREYEFKNAVMSAGKGWLAGCAVGKYRPLTHIALGSKDTAVSPEQTTLEYEELREKINLTQNIAHTFVVAADFGEHKGEPLELREAGLFDQDSGGMMFARTVFHVEPKQPDEELSVTWTITVN